jgi:hypothetical protein
MVKAGKNGTGKQRYKCNNCGTRTVMKNEDKTRQNGLKLFVKWLIDSTKVIDKVDMSRSTFYRKTKWCWDVIPKIKSEGIPSDFIFVDATYINKNLCLLIVRNERHVLGFRWAKSETFEDYYELLRTIEEPSFVICDGHRSITKAIKRLWKNVGIQRCLVHIAHDCERKLGKRSPCEINHLFRKHINKITTIDTVRKSNNWLNKFQELYEIHQDFIQEVRPTIDIETGEVLSWYKAHPKLNNVCNMIRKLQKNNSLFLFIENGIPNNSNYLEGGINSPFKNLLRCHRGLKLEPQKRMFEWYLLSRSNVSVNNFIKSLDFDVLYPKNDN